jgi:hypothetical protein
MNYSSALTRIMEKIAQKNPTFWDQNPEIEFLMRAMNWQILTLEYKLKKITDQLSQIPEPPAPSTEVTQLSPKSE